MAQASETSPPPEYVLGTGDDELQRLRLQSRLWSDAAQAAWKRAKVHVGQRALDLGCGPGFAAFELAEFVTPSGAVIAIDESPRFIAHLNAQSAARGLPQLRGLVADVQALEHPDLTPESFDLAYARWVLCFLARPEDAVARVARLLRPGGRFVIHDYFNYASMTAGPRRTSYDRVVAAASQSWIERGGDPDVVGRLVRMLPACGLRVEHLDVHVRIARPGEAMFAWPDSWWRNYGPKLVEMGLLAAADCAQLIADLEEIAAHGTDFVQCPPVYEIIAVKAE